MGLKGPKVGLQAPNGLLGPKWAFRPQMGLKALNGPEGPKWA